VASKLSLFLAELKRRKVYNVAAVYAAVGVGISLAVPDLFSAFDLPSLAARLVIILIVIGFPIALVLAWAYEVKPEEPGEAAKVPAPTIDTPRSDQRKSIVVLPFDNLSPDPGDAYFSDGLTEEIIAKLSYIRPLRVISRNSALALKGTQKDTRAIAEELGVQYVLEGSVRKAGSDLRITAQLIEAVEDEHLWAETYDRNLEDVFHVQTDVAEKIALALRTEITPREKEKVRRVPTENLRAYDFYVRALHVGQGLLPDDLAEGARLAQEAIALDPEFAQAYAWLAEMYTVSGFYANERPSDLYPRIAAAATRAMELDPQAGEPLTAMAAKRLFYEWDWSGAEQDLNRAMELSPDYSSAYRWKGLLLLCSGRFEEAERSVRQGLVSDPFSPDGHNELGQILAMGGRPHEAAQVLESSAGHWPNHPQRHLWLGLSHLYAGDPKAALPPVQTALSLSGAIPFFEAMRGVVLAAVGRAAEAREVLEDLKARSTREYVDPYNLFALTVTLDGFDNAVPYLGEALEVRSFFLPYLGVVPRFRPLHGDPRFRAVLEKVRPGESF
jgi:adenylate cyclase